MIDISNEISSLFLISTVVIYFAGFMLVYLAIKYHFFKKVDFTDSDKLLPNRVLRIMMLVLSICYTVPFVGSYRLYFTTTTTDYVFTTIIESVLYGGTLYIFLYNSLKFLINIHDIKLPSRPITFVLSNKTKYAIFISIIIFLSSLYTVQTLVFVNDQNSTTNNSGHVFVVNLFSDSAFTTSHDFSQIAYVIQEGGMQALHSNHYYIVVKNLQTKNSTLYNMCKSPDSCLYLGEAFSGGFFFANSSFLVIYEDYSGLVHLSFLNLQTGNITAQKNVDNLPDLPFNNEFKSLGSSLYYGTMQYFSNNTYFILYNSLNNSSVKIGLQSNFHYYFDDYDISAKMTNLAIHWASTIYFFNLKNQSNQINAYLQNAITLPSILDIGNLKFITWNKDQSVIYYSIYESTESRTTLYSYNFTSNQVNVLSVLNGQISITDINTRYNYFITGLKLKNLQIYSLKSTIPTLLLNTSSYYIASNPSTNELIGVNNSKLSLMSYNESTNSLRQIEILDRQTLASNTMIDPFIVNILTNLSVLLSISTFSILVITIILMYNDFQAHTDKRFLKEHL